MKQCAKRTLSLMLTLLMLSACSTQTDQPSDDYGDMSDRDIQVTSNETEESASSSEDPSKPEENTLQEESITEDHSDNQADDEWAPAPENTIWLANYEDGDSMNLPDTHYRLDEWLNAYQSGKSDQVYFDGDGSFSTWRLTCYGDEEYRIERLRSFDDTPESAYAKEILEGPISYSFPGGNLNLEVWKADPMIVELTEGEFSQDLSAVLSPQEAEQRVRDWYIEYSREPADQWSYQVRRRFAFVDTHFYEVWAYQDESSDMRMTHLAISADGAIILTGNDLDESWSLGDDGGKNPL